MEPKPKNQKQFIVHSDQNHEWIYNGRDTVSVNYGWRDGFNTRNTIHWRGITIHLSIRTPSGKMKCREVYYYTIFNERIYYRHAIVAHGGSATRGDKTPVIETDKYFLKIVYGYLHFQLTEKVKQIETASIVLKKENNPTEIKSVLEKENKSMKFSGILKRLFSKKQVRKKIEPEQPELKKPEPKQIDSEIEDTLFRVCPFKIVNASEDIKFNFPEREKEKFTVLTDQVTLYENDNPNVYVNSYAYFEKNDLVVDFWKLGYSYEDEEFIVVNERFVPLVYKEFKIESENKYQLLIGILNAFNGKGCFQKYEEFLESKKIPHGFRVRHDDEIGG